MTIVILAIVFLATVFYTYRIGFMSGYGAAQKEYLETLERRPGKNWYRILMNEHKST